MSPSHLLTLGQAAKQAKVAKSTVTRAIQKGELSCAEKVENGYRIDPAELSRWEGNRPKQLVQDSSAGLSETPETPALALLEQEVQHLRERLQDEKRRGDGLEQDRDAWRKQAQTLALAAPITPSAPPAAAVQPRRGLLGWFGRKTSATT